MSDDDTTFEQLATALGFVETEDEEMALERAKRELESMTEVFKNAGLDEAEARIVAVEFLRGYLRHGSGRGGLHPEHFPELLQQAFFRQGLTRLVLDISLSGDEYHLNLTVLAADEAAAEQLVTVARKVHERREKGEPS